VTKVGRSDQAVDVISTKCKIRDGACVVGGGGYCALHDVPVFPSWEYLVRALAIFSILESCRDRNKKKKEYPYKLSKISRLFVLSRLHVI